jgi:hypothetical protein
MRFYAFQALFAGFLLNVVSSVICWFLAQCRLKRYLLVSCSMSPEA